MGDERVHGVAGGARNPRCARAISFRAGRKPPRQALGRRDPTGPNFLALRGLSNPGLGDGGWGSPRAPYHARAPGSQEVPPRRWGLSQAPTLCATGSRQYMYTRGIGFRRRIQCVQSRRVGALATVRTSVANRSSSEYGTHRPQSRSCATANDAQKEWQPSSSLLLLLAAHAPARPLPHATHAAAAQIPICVYLLRVPSWSCAKLDCLLLRNAFHHPRRCCVKNKQDVGFYGPPGCRTLEAAGGRACSTCGCPKARRWYHDPASIGSYLCSG